MFKGFQQIKDQDFIEFGTVVVPRKMTKSQKQKYREYREKLEQIRKEQKIRCK